MLKMKLLAGVAVVTLFGFAASYAQTTPQPGTTQTNPQPTTPGTTQDTVPPPTTGMGVDAGTGGAGTGGTGMMGMDGGAYAPPAAPEFSTDAGSRPY